MSLRGLQKNEPVKLETSIMGYHNMLIYFKQIPYSFDNGWRYIAVCPLLFVHFLEWIIFQYH